MTELTNHEENLYMRVYNYYRKMIQSGQLKKGARLPSVRRCAEQLSISRTTVENAYLLLAAEGYIISKPQSGYYVTGLHEQSERAIRPERTAKKKSLPEIRYDFSSQSVDRDSFDFDIWRRYIKSALRQDERLLSYGEPQGERELRQALAAYVAVSRNVICEPEQIVVGAGTQSLLHILCPMLREREFVSFPTASMIQGITIFQNYGFEIHYKDKDAPIIYVSPSRMNRMGDVMPVSRRLEMLHYAGERGSLIIEDDYESEFQYQSRPIPALYSLSGGRGVVYLGTFSRLLLPSIRISYMVLPPELLPLWQQSGECYNQTASKTEQIALGQFIRDGHMEARIRKLRRLYLGKTKTLYQALQKALGEGARLEEHSLCVTLTLDDEEQKEVLLSEAEQAGIRFDGVVKGKDRSLKLVLSSLTMPADVLEDAAHALSDLLRRTIPSAEKTGLPGSDNDGKITSK